MWKVVRMAAVFAESHPKRVRIGRADRTWVVVYAPTLQGDTLRGTDSLGGDEAIPLIEVRELALHKPRKGRIIAGMILRSAITVGLIRSQSRRAGGGGY